MNKRKILVVEDEDDIADLVALHLRDEDYNVSIARDGHDGMRKAFAQSWDLIILDLRLPGPDGIALCRALREKQNYVPILMLTSKSSELDRVLGLEIGADDYLTKPFSVSELVARVRALFRRIDAVERKKEEEGGTLSVGALRIDQTCREVRLDQKLVSLTAKEFDLLVHFARNPGRVFTRNQLLDSVWGYGQGGYEHTVNSHINRLRNKIETNTDRPRYIVTVWGVGYKLDSESLHAK